MYVIHTSVRLQ